MTFYFLGKGEEDNHDGALRWTGTQLETCQNHVWSQVTGGSSDPTEITILHNGLTFAPTLILDPGTTVLWTFDDGTTSTSATPNKVWGAAIPRVTTLVVTPWSGVSRMNFGYAAEDGGDPAIELVASCNVTGFAGMELVKNTLGQLCVCNNISLALLELEDFVNLDTLEAFGASLLTHVKWSNMWELERICFEGCNLEELDLSCCPKFADLRGAENEFNGVNFGTSGQHTWHICVRTNSLYAGLPTLRQFPLLQDLLIWNDHLAGALDLNTGTVSALTTVQASGNAFTTADFTDRFKGVGGPGIIDIGQNELTAITLTGCTHIISLDAADNNLNQAAVDGILVHMADTVVTPNGVLDLRGNAAPSGLGVVHAAILNSHGWTVHYEPFVGLLFTSATAAVDMSCVVSGGATVTWTYAGGAQVTGANPAAYNWGSPAARISAMEVSDPAQLTEIAIHSDVMSITGLLGLSNFVNLTTICDIGDTELVDVDVTDCHNLTTLHFLGTSFTATTADTLFIRLDAAVGAGVGQAIFIPNVVTGASLAARTSLAGKGWTINLT
jgi:hypothetical protein